MKITKNTSSRSVKKTHATTLPRHTRHIQFLLVLLVVSIALPLFGGLLIKHLSFAKSVAVAQNTMTQKLIQESQGQLLSLLNHSSRLTERLNQNEVLIAAFKQHAQSEGQAGLRRIGSVLKDTVAYATDAKLIPAGTVRKRTDYNPPLSFSELNLVRSIQRGQLVKPDLQYAAIPIKERDVILGTVLLAFDLAQMKKTFPALTSDEGYLEIGQPHGNGASAVFYSSGNATFLNQEDVQQVTVSNNGWIIKAYLNPVVLAESLDPALFWGLNLGVALVLVVAIIIFHGAQQREIERNLRTLAGALKSKLEGKTPQGNRYTWPYFNTSEQNIEKTMSLLLSKAKPATSTKNPAPAPSQPVIDEISSTESDILDLDLDLEDESLFETPQLSVAQSPESSVSTPSPDRASEPAPAELSLPATLFREYDIRGIVGQTLTPQIVAALGQALGTCARQKGGNTIVIGRDGRNSSESLSKALTSGILASGCDVLDIGMVPTPLVYFGTFYTEYSSGVMITGSHNPPEYNGLKMVIGGETLYGSRIADLKNMIENRQLKSGQGHYQSASITASYLEKIVSDIVLARPIKVVVDAGNGVAGPVMLNLLEGLGCETVPLYCDVDGNFPNHHPDPSKPENLKQLIAKVQSEQAEIGLAFDGDGDRLGVVTPAGKIIYPDRLLMLYAKDVLSHNPGGDIIFDVKCTGDLINLVSELGGRPIMWKTGHSLIKAKLKETGALLAGEMSGHIFFNDRWYGFDDALYSAARLLELLAMEPYTLDEIFDQLPEKRSTPELSIPVTEETKFKIIEALKQKGQFSDGKVLTIDGIRIDYERGWGLIRASNTTPTLVARFEAVDEAELNRIKQEFRANLLGLVPNLKLPF